MNRQDLKNYRYNQKWIDERLAYLEEYQTRLTKITSIITDMPRASSPVEDKFAENLAKLLDNMELLMQKMTEESNKQKEILEKLEEIEQPYRLILEKVYIQGETLVEVASEMNYSYRDLCRKHGIALNLFDNIVKSKE